MSKDSLPDNQTDRQADEIVPAYERKYSKKTFAFLGTIWVVGSYFLGNTLIGLLALAIQASGVNLEGIQGSYPNELLFTTYALSIPAVLAFILLIYRPYFKHRSLSLRKLIGFNRKPKLIDLLYALPAYAIYFTLAAVAYTIASNFLTEGTLNEAQDLGITHPSVLYQYIMIFIMLVILPPLFEEILFRGFIFGTLRSGFSFATSAVVTSILFGFAHGGQINLFIDTFLLSFVMCYAREKTGNLYVGMIIHAIKNLLAFTLLYLLRVV